MEEDSDYSQIKKSSLEGVVVDNDEQRQLTSPSVRSTCSARIAGDEARFARSPGIKILQMADQAPSYQCRFSVKDFHLRNHALPDDCSDDYDTDLESEEVGRIIDEIDDLKSRRLSSRLSSLQDS